MYTKAWRNIRYFAGGTKPHCGRGREGPCFAVCALVCDFSLKAECVPAFTRESERGPFVRKAENAMKSGLGQRCGGNFLAIFVGASIGEKPNFTGEFFEWRRPFDFSTRYGVVSAPICAFYRHSLGGFSIVSIQPCPLFSDSGSKVGQGSLAKAL